MAEPITAVREPKEDPGITRLDIDRYRRLLKLDLDDARRAETLALLVEAETRLSARLTREKWEYSIPAEAPAPSSGAADRTILEAPKAGRG